MPDDTDIGQEMEQRGPSSPLPSAVAQTPAMPPPAAPTLTPVQRQFLAELALQPQATAMYQPAQSFDSPEYQKSIYEWEQEVRRKAETARAEQAINAGIRYIYQRRYDDDLKHGLPESQAFSRMMMGIALHTPKTDPVKMYQAFQQPFQPAVTNLPGVGNVVRSGRYGERIQFPPAALPTGPISGVPVLNPDGTTNENYIGVPSATGRGFTIHPRKATEATLTPTAQAHFLERRLDKLNKQLEEFPAQGTKAWTPEIQKARQPLEDQVTALERQIEELLPKKKGSTSTTPKTGATNEVVRVTKDGRKAIFDATTKQFLRYARD